MLGNTAIAKLGRRTKHSIKMLGYTIILLGMESLMHRLGANDKGLIKRRLIDH